MPTQNLPIKKVPGDYPWLLEPRLAPQQFIYTTLRTSLYVVFRQRVNELRGHLATREAERAVVPSRVRQRSDVPAPHEEAVYHHDVERLPTVRKMVAIGSGASRRVRDYTLTRYACYLIAMSGDSGKQEIAFAQSYFALSTRRNELIEH